MTKGLVRLAAIAASGAAFLVLTGCGGASPDDGYGGPPPQAYDRDAPPPGLMGGKAPARSDGSGLLGGPAGDGVMAPIPNPADLTRAERVRWYGHKYDHLPEPKGRRAGATATPGYQLISRRKADGTLEVSMRPIANPEDMSPAERRRVYGYRYAPRAETAAAPRRRYVAEPVARPAPRPAVAAKPAPVVKPAPRPVAVTPPKAVAAAPVAKPAAPLKTAPAPVIAPKLTPAQQLGAAVRPEVMQGATLTVPEGLAKGEEAKVSLSLPASLFDVIKREAAKLGLGKAAKKAEVSATLTGDGYEITPNAAQTQKLKAGEAARFDWNVKPGVGDKAPLKATVDGTLTGDRKAKTGFSLGSLEQAVAAPVEEVKKAAKGFHFPAFSLKALSIPGKPVVDLPVLGQTASEKIVGAGIALLALLAVLGMARSASANRARAERRRKFRTMSDYGRGDVDPEPEPAAPAPSHERHVEHQSYVNPMLAAAGGAAAAHVAHEAHDAHEAHAETHAASVDDHGHAETPAAEDHAHVEAPHAEPVEAPAEAGHDHHHREPEHV